MYKVLLCCTSGVTGSALVKAMKDGAKQKNIDVMIWTVANEAIELSWADADCILVAPQEISVLENVRSLVKSAIPVTELDVTDFTNANGKEVLEQAIKLIDR